MSGASVLAFYCVLILCLLNGHVVARVFFSDTRSPELCFTRFSRTNAEKRLERNWNSGACKGETLQEDVVQHVQINVVAQSKKSLGKLVSPSGSTNNPNSGKPERDVDKCTSRVNDKSDDK